MLVKWWIVNENCHFLFTITKILAKNLAKKFKTQEKNNPKNASISNRLINLKKVVNTVWQFEDFSVNQILREIKFGEFWNSVKKRENLSHWKNISWNQLISNFFSKNGNLTEKTLIFRKNRDRVISYFSTLWILNF